MNKNLVFAIAVLFFSSHIAAQTKGETKEQWKEDSVQLAEVKRKYPDNFRFNIIPVKLTDKSLYVSGSFSALRVIDNVISDSIHRNYYADMPDTSSKIPYASFFVVGEKVNIQLIQHGFFMTFDSQYKNGVELVTNTKGINKVFLPTKEDEKFFNKESIRISINGKPLFNWKKVADFKRDLYKLYSFENTDRGMYSYEYLFTLCDTILNINDQLFIEIKEDSTNQMTDSYNITRKASAPEVSAILPLHQKDNIITGNSPAGPGEKKNFTLNADVDEVYAELSKTTIKDSNAIEYIYKKADSPETQWSVAPDGSKIKLILNAGKSYDLFLRYTAQKETVSSYTITVNPHWWQTTSSKIIGGSLSGLIIILITFSLYSQKKKIRVVKTDAAQKQSLLELKSIQAQLNPHFVFNSLSSIQALINTGKTEEANQYLSSFSMLMRNTLADNDKPFCSIESEIKKLEQYIKLEQLRFGFGYIIHVDEGINTTATEIPTLLIQPVVENAIKHGITGADGKVIINFLKEGNNLTVEICDNGKGFNLSETNDGYGLRLTADRIKLINTINNNNFIHQKTISGDSGTTVSITFNQWL